MVETALAWGPEGLASRAGSDVTQHLDPRTIVIFY